MGIRLTLDGLLFEELGLWLDPKPNEGVPIVSVLPAQNEQAGWHGQTISTHINSALMKAGRQTPARSIIQGATPCKRDRDLHL